jgi:hypothetical protein
VVVTVSVPEVPVKVRVYCPGSAEGLAVTVKLLYEVVGLGENDAVTPLGRPDTERFTLPLNPYCGYTPTLVAAEAPWPTLIPPADMMKAGA